MPGWQASNLSLSVHGCHKLFIDANLIMKCKRLVNRAVLQGAGLTGYGPCQPVTDKSCYLLDRSSQVYGLKNTWHAFHLSGYPLNTLARKQVRTACCKTKSVNWLHRLSHQDSKVGRVIWWHVPGWVVISETWQSGQDVWSGNTWVSWLPCGIEMWHISPEGP